MMKEIRITLAEQNQRFDKFLLKYFNEAPKSFIYKMLRKKRIKYNGKRAAGNEILRDGDLIQIYLSDEVMSEFISEQKINETKIDFDIVYEDDKILIVNKPQGIIAHADRDNSKDTLQDMILYYLFQKGEYNPKIPGAFKPSICNRLDRNTSGIVICAKDLQTSQQINEMIREHEIDKYYKAVVKGKIDKPGVITGYHTKDIRNTVTISETPDGGGKEVITEYTPLKWSDSFTVLSIRLVTGKSHQIRASLKSIGHPIVGDTKYGDAKINDEFKKRFKICSQLLHAEKIIFLNENIYLYKKKFCAKLPNVFLKIVQNLF